jgi:hypothetical protein
MKKGRKTKTRRQDSKAKKVGTYIVLSLFFGVMGNYIYNYIVNRYYEYRPFVAVPNMLHIDSNKSVYYSFAIYNRASSPVRGRGMMVIFENPRIGKPKICVLRQDLRPSAILPNTPDFVLLDGRDSKGRYIIVISFEEFKPNETKTFVIKLCGLNNGEHIESDVELFYPNYQAEYTYTGKE